jgi:hypothetical protein
MRKGLLLSFPIICLAFASFGSAADGEAKYEDLLVRVLTANAHGDCPGNLMSPLLKDACEDQMSKMRPRFDALGAIKGAEYRGIQQTPNGPAEAYRVTFENGHMSWIISTGADGKIVILWSPG